MRFRLWLAGLLLACMSVPAAADVLIVGGTRGVGLAMAQQLQDAGVPVTVFVRESSDTGALDAAGIGTVVGDALERDTLDAALAAGDYDIVVSTLGGNPTIGYAVDSTGNVNAIDAAVEAGAEYFVLISSIGVGSSRDTMPEGARKALAGALEGKEIAEAHLAESGLRHTIIRPGVLTNKPLNGLGFLTDNPAAIGIISRAEVARLAIATMAERDVGARIVSAIERKAPKGE